jgi:hypothetical protein
MKIRRRDGTMAVVGDDYIIQDGEAMLVPLSFMDARRGRIHDGNGGPVGQRPGFLVRDNAAEDQAVEAAYREYAKGISERWRQGPGQRPSPARSEPPQTGGGLVVPSKYTPRYLHARAATRRMLI